MSLNLHRRHLTESQRAMVFDKIATMSHGGDRRSKDFDQGANLRFGQSDAAEMLGVSRRSVQHARAVRKHGIPELGAAVEAGEIAVSAAAEIARKPEGAPVQAPSARAFLAGVLIYPDPRGGYQRPGNGERFRV